MVTFASFKVTLVEKLPLTVSCLVILVSLVETLVENEALGAKNDPDIPVDVNTPFPSNAVVLVLNEALSAIKFGPIILPLALTADAVTEPPRAGLL